VSLGLLRNPPEDALELGVGFLGVDLVGHLHEALGLLRVVGRRFGLAWHAGNITLCIGNLIPNLYGWRVNLKLG
jgi:hypothetical protein